MLGGLTEKTAEEFIAEGVVTEGTGTYALLFSFLFHLDKYHCRRNLFGNTAEGLPRFTQVLQPGILSRNGERSDNDEQQWENSE